MRASQVGDGGGDKEVKGLASIRHEGPPPSASTPSTAPSTISLKSFWRGAGVGDDFISLIKALGGSIQFYSCFISYSTKDQLFADRLYADLQANNVRCWFVPHDLNQDKSCTSRSMQPSAAMKNCYWFFRRRASTANE